MVFSSLQRKNFFTAILILWLSGYSFLLDLAVGFDGWLNASEAVNCLTDLMESLITHWLTEN